MRLLKKVFALLLFFVFVSAYLVPTAAASGENTYRIVGSNRYATAVEISKEGWSTGADNVVLVNGTNFPDAATGSPLAYQLDAPILLTRQHSLDNVTRKELERLEPDTVYILGGDGAISTDVEKELQSLDYEVVRISGTSRFETAVKVGEELRRAITSDTVVLAVGNSYPDALSIAPSAAKNHRPILFTNKNNLTPATEDALINWGIKNVIIVGGEGAVSATVEDQLNQMDLNVERLQGTNRFLTSLNIAKEYDEGDYNGAIVATGDDFADALTGSVLAAKMDKPVLLVRRNSIEPEVKNYIDQLSATTYILGGDSAVSTKVFNIIAGKESSNNPNSNSYFHTYYISTLEQALDEQMARGGNVRYNNFNERAPRSEVRQYLNPDNFLTFSRNFEKPTFTLRVNTASLRVRQQPTTNSTHLTNVLQNQTYAIRDVSDNGWYQIRANGHTGWVSGDFVVVPPVRGAQQSLSSILIEASVLNVREKPTTSSTRLTTVSRDEIYIVEGKQDGWYKITTVSNGTKYTGWVSGDYAKPTQQVPREMYQFLILSGSAGTTTSDLNHILSGKGILHNTGKHFLDAGKKYNINEIYLVAHALLETGNGTSSLATGTVVSQVDGKPVEPRTVYNMYGIGARDEAPNRLGAEYAYTQGWFTPEKAIVDGADWISRRYVNHPTYKQDTLYKMKWNPENPATHQYATDVGWAIKQINRILSLYNQCQNFSLRFDIPVYYQ